MVYAGTVYLYSERSSSSNMLINRRPSLCCPPPVSKKSASTTRRVVVTAITALYLLCLGTFTIEWYYFNKNIIINGTIREAIVLSILEGGPGLNPYAAGEFLFYSVFIVSDGLLV